MEHLSREALARLVDSGPTPREQEHLAACPRCAAELDALREQTEQLRALPEIVPPRGDWAALEARLRSEGLLHDPGLLDRLGLSRTPAWMKTAAALLLFASGAVAGASLSGTTATGPTAASGGAVVQPATLDDAASQLQEAEARYVAALSRYRELAAEQGGEAETVDPAARFAALEYLVAAGQAAVRQAPADPFLNGLLASTLAEREATLRRISTRGNSWY